MSERRPLMLFPRPTRAELAAAPPGPRRARWPLGVGWLLREHALLERCRAEYGEVFSLDMWPLGLLVVVADPAAIKAVFTADAEQLRAGEGNRVLRPVAGPESVLLLDGERHLNRRRLMLPAFHGERVAVFAELIAAIAAEEIEGWPTGRPFPLLPSLQAITLRVILRAVFGIEDRARGAELERTIPLLMASPALLSPLLQHDFGPASPWRRFRALCGEVDEILLDEVARRRGEADLEQRDDILSMLLLARDESGEAMSDDELRDQLVTLLLAGHETTATALAWTFERLLRNPAALERAQAALAVGEGEYLDCVIKESLRCRPVIPYALRYAAAPLQLGAYTIPAGALVGASMILTHNRAEHYREPERFIPERFADGAPDTYGWIPFGGGTRRCLGASFAMLEMRVILETVLGRWELEAVEARPERPRRRFVTYQPDRGARALLRARRGAPSPAPAAALG